MTLLRSSPGCGRAKEDYLMARQQLREVCDADREAGRNWETEEYLDANDGAADAESAAREAGVSALWLWHNM